MRATIANASQCGLKIFAAKMLSRHRSALKNLNVKFVVAAGSLSLYM